MTASTIAETIGISATAPVIGGLVAALLFAVANNVQRHAASEVPHGHVGPVGLLLRLLRNPRWLAGSSAAVLALLVQAWALSQGGVILVQAVIASTLVWSLALEAVVERRWPSPAQVLGAALVAVGISVLVLIGKPGAGGQFTDIGRAALVWVVVGFVGVGALLTSRRRPKGRRTAVVMGAAAGVCFALDAVFLRGLTAALSPLVPVTLVINLAGFAVASLLGNLVIQRAFQMAPLRHVLPAMAAAEPVTAFLCARFVFGERLQGGAQGSLGVGVGLALMVVGVILCAVATPARKPLRTPSLIKEAGGIKEPSRIEDDADAIADGGEPGPLPAPPVLAPTRLRWTGPARAGVRDPNGTGSRQAESGESSGPGEPGNAGDARESGEPASAPWPSRGR